MAISVILRFTFTTRTLFNYTIRFIFLLYCVMLKSVYFIQLQQRPRVGFFLVSHRIFFGAVMDNINL